MGSNMAVITANNPDRFGIILFILAAVLLVYTFLSIIIANNRRHDLIKLAKMIEMAHSGQKITREMFYEDD